MKLKILLSDNKRSSRAACTSEKFLAVFCKIPHLWFFQNQFEQTTLNLQLLNFVFTSTTFSVTLLLHAVACRPRYKAFLFYKENRVCELQTLGSL